MDSKEKELPAASTFPLVSFSHVSILCSSVKDSTKFYEGVLGFTLIKRPSSLDFEEAWLFNYGIGIHLLQCRSVSDKPTKPGVINPKSNHFSFQCKDIQLVKEKLEETRMEYGTVTVEE